MAGLPKMESALEEQYMQMGMRKHPSLRLISSANGCLLHHRGTGTILKLNQYPADQIGQTLTL